MNIISIVTGAPWWVYVLFVYLIIRGLEALRPQRSSLYRLLIMPVILIVWSIISLSSKYGPSLQVFSIYFFAFLIGAFLGWLFLYRGIKVNKATNIIYIPGSWYPLILYILFFIFKYCLGVVYAMHPELRSQITFWLLDVIVSGLVSGIFGGRFLHIVNQLYKK